MRRDAVEVELLDVDHAATVYNFHVRAFHTYYVLAGHTPVLVHNTRNHADAAKKARIVENISFSSRRDAELAARERAGIGPDDVADAEWTVGDDPVRRGTAGYRYSENAGAHGTYQQFETENGSRVIVNHTNDPNQGPHYHAGRPREASRSGVDFGWGQDFEPYKAVGNKHHFYYPAGS